jgi:hypothetical protein
MQSAMSSYTREFFFQASRGSPGRGFVRVTSSSARDNVRQSKPSTFFPAPYPLRGPLVIDNDVCQDRHCLFLSGYLRCDDAIFVFIFPLPFVNLIQPTFPVPTEYHFLAGG